MRKCQKHFLAVWALLGATSLVFPALPVIAQTAWDAPGALSLRGFGTLGVARSSNGDAEVVRDVFQPRGVSDHWSGNIDSNIGLQAGFALTDKLGGVVQAISRYKATGNFKPELSWAFLKYDHNPSLRVRLGRIGTDFLMRSDSQQIGYSQTVVRPNIDSFYALSSSYIDGADVLLTTPAADGLLRSKIYYGLLRAELPAAQESTMIYRAPSFGLNLDYEKGNWSWRASYSQLNFDSLDAPPLTRLVNALVSTGLPTAVAAADQIRLEGTHGRFYSLGTIYENGPVVAQFMLGQFQYQSSLYQNKDTGMLLVSRRVGRLTPFVGLSWVRSRASHVSTGLPNVGSGAVLNAALASAQARSRADQNTYSAGVRWDFMSNAALKFQLDAIRGSPGSVVMLRERSDDWSGRATVFSLTFDFVF